MINDKQKAAAVEAIIAARDFCGNENEALRSWQFLLAFALKRGRIRYEHTLQR